MENIVIETGEREYSLNDKCTVRFNPADPSFADRLYSAFDDLRAKQEAKDVDTKKLSNREMFDYLGRLNTEMRETIDGIFGQPICAQLFGDISVYAIANGMPIWFNFVVAILDELEESVKREKVLYSEKLVKYTNKYRK